MQQFPVEKLISLYPLFVVPWVGCVESLGLILSPSSSVISSATPRTVALGIINCLSLKLATITIAWLFLVLVISSLCDDVTRGGRSPLFELVIICGQGLSLQSGFSLVPCRLKEGDSAFCQNPIVLQLSLRIWVAL